MENKLKHQVQLNQPYDTSACIGQQLALQEETGGLDQGAEQKNCIKLDWKASRREVV